MVGTLPIQIFCVKYKINHKRTDKDTTVQLGRAVNYGRREKREVADLRQEELPAEIFPDCAQHACIMSGLVWLVDCLVCCLIFDRDVEWGCEAKRVLVIPTLVV